MTSDEPSRSRQAHSPAASDPLFADYLPSRWAFVGACIRSQKTTWFMAAKIESFVRTPESAKTCWDKMALGVGHPLSGFFCQPTAKILEPQQPDCPRDHELNKPTQYDAEFLMTYDK